MTDQGAALAERVRQAAAAAGYTTNSLAEAAGIPPKTLWRRIERDPDLFKVEEIVAIARATGADWVWLASGAGTAAA